MVKLYIFTFGFGQQHEGMYRKIYADNENLAREKMVRDFGDKWSMIYDSEEEAGVKKFNLKELKDFKGKNNA